MLIAESNHQEEEFEEFNWGRDNDTDEDEEESHPFFEPEIFYTKES